MMADAESHAEEDRKRREEAEIRNQADALVFQTEKFLEENSDKVPADAKANVEEPLAALKKALEGEDLEAIKNAVEQVGTASQALGAALYENTKAQGESANADDDVVDAEIVEEAQTK
jgi:molecular chaperone DnaK